MMMMVMVMVMMMLMMMYNGMPGWEHDDLYQIAGVDEGTRVRGKVFGNGVGIRLISTYSG